MARQDESKLLMDMFSSGILSVFGLTGTLVLADLMLKKTFNCQVPNKFIKINENSEWIGICGRGKMLAFV